MRSHAVATEVEASAGRPPLLFRPGAIGPLTLKNRVTMAPTTTRTADADGFVIDESIAYYAERAAAEVGLTAVETAAA